MGCGGVGQAFMRLVREKQDDCRKRYGLCLRLSAVFNSSGGLFLPQEKRQKNLFADFDPGSDPEKNEFWKQNLTLKEAMKSLEPGVWVDCTPSDLKDGRPALEYAHWALEAGWHMVTANKGPLAVDFGGLWEKARKNGLSIGMSGAAAAALPTLDVALGALAGAAILGFEGILNGTSNYILTRMGEGMGYREALREARTKGIAEPDPSQDVEGWDTAAKVLIIANAIFQADHKLADVNVEGISRIPSDLILEARDAGRSLKLLGRVTPRSEGLHMETKVTLLDPSHALFGVDGTRKGITYFTDTMDSITVTGGKSDPRGAAAALLKDIINVSRGKI